jgi:transketolase
MRNAFAEEMTKVAAIDKRVVVLSGDIGNRLFDKLKAVDESRFYNCGVAEANMMGVAAGMALSGLRPFVYTITPFTTTRCFEQIRVDVCYHRAPVVIVGTGSGLSYAELGPTHHSLEDMAILRTLPGMRVMAPCDSSELRQVLHEVLKDDSPTYIRIGKKGEADIHTSLPDLRLGKALIIRPGSDVTLLCAGNMMAETLKAADLLAASGLSAEVVSFHTVKPLDEALLSQLFSEHKLVVVLEEHGLIGGAGSAVLEWGNRVRADLRKLVCVGGPDRFLSACGDQEEARILLGLTPTVITQKIFDHLK